MRQIYGQKWYRPMEIAKLRLITNSVNSQSVNSNYEYILGLIKTGRLRAKNYSKGNKPFWLVPESEVQRYHETVTRLEQ